MCTRLLHYPHLYIFLRKYRTAKNHEAGSLFVVVSMDFQFLVCYFIIFRDIFELCRKITSTDNHQRQNENSFQDPFPFSFYDNKFW